MLPSWIRARADVHPAVRVARIHLRDLQERRFGALHIALQQQADAVIVPALAHLRIHAPAVASGSGAPASSTCSVALLSAITVVGMSGIALICPDTFDVSPVNTHRPSS